MARIAGQGAAQHIEMLAGRGHATAAGLCKRGHAVDMGKAASRSGVKWAAMRLITVAEQLTEDRMPMKLRVPTPPSARTNP